MSIEESSRIIGSETELIAAQWTVPSVDGIGIGHDTGVWRVLLWCLVDNPLWEQT